MAKRKREGRGASYVRRYARGRLPSVLLSAIICQRSAVPVPVPVPAEPSGPRVKLHHQPHNVAPMTLFLPFSS